MRLVKNTEPGLDYGWATDWSEAEPQYPYSGGCPVPVGDPPVPCGNDDGYLNVRRDNHYCVCDQHRACWYIGTGLFSSWQDETEEEQERNAAIVDSYAMVVPVQGRRLTK